MAIDYVHATRWATATRLTDVATDTTLAAATRYEFAAKTVYVPEGTRTFLSAFMKMTFIGANTSALDIDAVRIGSKVQAAAFVDVDTTLADADTGETECFVIVSDITSNVVTNNGGGSSFTIQPAIAVAMEAASAIRNITCEIFLTYSYDSAASTHIKTVVIPLQSDVTDLSTSYAEVGAAGTGACGANQIPQLTGTGSPKLTEASITIRDHYIILHGNVSGSAATTDCTLSVRLDGSTDLTRAVYEQALQSAAQVYDIVDSSLMATTTAAHAFELKSDVADRFWGMGGLMVVTYEFSPGSTTSTYNSVCVPLASYPATGTPEYIQTSANGLTRLTAKLNIQEPATITMEQCGVYLVTAWNSTTTFTVGAPSQTARPYLPITSQVGDTHWPIIHRTDHSSSNWALARGENTLHLDIYLSAAIARQITGYAIINYTSAVAAAGIASHNQTTYWFQKALEGTAANNPVVTPVEPVIPSAAYSLQGVYVDALMRSDRKGYEIVMERLSGEDSGAGWLSTTYPVAGGASNEIGSIERIVPLTAWFQRNTYALSDGFGCDVESERKWRYSYAGTNGCSQSLLVMTHHAIKFKIAGTVLMDGVELASDVVNVFEYAEGDGGDADNRYPACLVGQAATDGSGYWEFDVYDSNKKYFVRAHDGTFPACSEALNPGGGDLNIDVYSSNAEKFHGSSFNRGFN